MLFKCETFLWAFYWADKFVVAQSDRKYTSKAWAMWGLIGKKKHQDWSKTSVSASRSKQVKSDLCDLQRWLKCFNQQINVWQKSIDFWKASIMCRLQIEAQDSRCCIKASITTSVCLWCHQLCQGCIDMVRRSVCLNIWTQQIAAVMGSWMSQS